MPPERASVADCIAALDTGSLHNRRVRLQLAQGLVTECRSPDQFSAENVFELQRLVHGEIDVLRRMAPALTDTQVYRNFIADLGVSATEFKHFLHKAGVL